MKIDSSRFRPGAREAHGFEKELVKAMCIVFLTFVVMFPLISGDANMAAVNSNATPEEASILSVGGPQNLMHVTLPPSVYRVAPARTMGLTGFAYVDTGDELLLFLDPLSGISFNMSVGPAYALYNNLIVEDVDDDGHDEFIGLKRLDTTTLTPYIADLNDDTLTEWTGLQGVSGTLLGIGDFNGDTSPDLAFIANWAPDYSMHTIDLSTGSIIGTFNVGTYLRVHNAIGRFSDPSADQIVLTNDTHVWVVNGDGTCNLNMTHTTPRGILRFDYGGGFSDIAILDILGDLTLYQGTDLAQIYQIGVGPPGGQLYAKTGNFTGDSQEDIVVSTPNWRLAFFINGTNWEIFRETPGVYATAQSFETGMIDRDTVTDVALIADPENPSFIHGSNAEIAYTESLIETVDSIRIFDLNEDVLEDIFITSGNDLYILVSELEPPEVTQAPLDPLHPTVIDEFITVEVGVHETTAVESAEFFFRKEGNPEWTQPQGGMQTPDNANTFFAFLVGLEAANYEYYIAVNDVYHNTGYWGNETHPLIFEVTGHLAWQHDKSEIYSAGYSHHLIAQGNLSDGTPLIYSLELDPSGKTVYLNKYLPEGALVNSYPIDFTSGYDFRLASGMFDGDSVLDPVALVSKDVTIEAYVLHGSSFGLYHSSVSPIFQKGLRTLEILDGDGDGIDELYHLNTNDFFTLARMDGAGTWTWRNLTDSTNPDLRPQFLIGAESGPGKASYLTIIRGNSLIEIVDGSDINTYSSITIPTGGFSAVQAKSMTTLERNLGGAEEFAIGMTFWTGPIPETRLYLFDGTAQNIGDLEMYIIPNNDVTFLAPFDANLDGIDELVVLHDSGELMLTKIGTTLEIEWTIQVTGSTPLSAIETDFNGWPVNEFLLFTKEDGLLTIISNDGDIRTAVVGEVYVPIPIGDIDPGNGMEIAAYPIVTDVGKAVIGAIRDLDLFYRLSVGIEYAPTIVDQGNEFKANVTVLNIYGESVDDAAVYVQASFITPEGLQTPSFNSYYNPDESHYESWTDASWPIGPVNLSVLVNHNFYHFRYASWPDAVTVRSNLHVLVFAPELVYQGGNMTIEVLVHDNLEGRVNDSSVMVHIGGSDYPAVPINDSYFLEVAEVQLPAGLHPIGATATHPYGIGPGFGERNIEVLTLASTLSIVSDFPAIVQQNDRIEAAFEIFDAYGRPVNGANAFLRSGPTIFNLDPTATPGIYLFNRSIDLGIGNYTFELHVIKDRIRENPAQQIEFEVFGDLIPNVFFTPRVEAGATFEVNVFVKDTFGPVFQGTSVIIEINGTRYTQTGVTGEPDFMFMVLADFLVGENTFMVYVNATYANPWSKEYTIRAFADASAYSSIRSLGGDTVAQGGQTTMELTLVDWLDRPVSGATVTFFVKALSYPMQESTPGVYTAQVTTVGWSPGEYNYSVSVQHDDIETGDALEGVLVVTGQIVFDVTFFPESGTQGQSLLVAIAIQDIYGNPIPDLDVTVSLMDLPPVQATETYAIGTYEASIIQIPATEGYGEFTVSITAQGQFVQATDTTETITISPATPDFTLSTQSVSIGAGLSFLLSLIGMFVYFRISASTRIDDESVEGLRRSVRRMDRIYLLMALGSGAGLMASYWYFLQAELGLALVLTVALLGMSVLMYGLWLYRDAVSAVLIKGALNRGRIVLGLWHLVFVPVVIVMMLLYGTGIDWFRAYIIEVSTSFGDLTIPTIMTTIFAAYVSSIIVVVVNLYREVSKGIKKVMRMEEAGTPRRIVEDEKISMINRFSSSIRLKFLMFLVVVGATTVMSMEFLQSFQLAIIVLMPVLFLVVIPFIASKIIQVLGKVTGAVAKRSSVPTE
ncbi:MAG: hypothetical protein ACFFEX_00400 [Candidatus Thorarchaeota archaeon]